MATSTKPYGYRRSPSGGAFGVRMKVADAATGGIAVGDMVIMESGNAGYIVPCSAGDIPIGVALEACSAPSADGAQSILVCIDRNAIFEYPPDAGTVTQALVGTTMDTGGAQSINIDASSDDVITVHEVYLDRNTLGVSIAFTYLGVA